MIILFHWITCNATVAPTYYDKHAQGWHWYQDPQEKKKNEKSDVTLSSKNDPTQQMKMMRKAVQKSLDNAILSPTRENVAAYIRIQNEVNERAEKFSSVWEQALLQEPSLNYQLIYPTTKVALDVYHENESKEKEVVVAQFAKERGLFFFYRSSCVYCKKFAPILVNFANRYGISVIPITLDGNRLPEFPQTVLDSGQAAQMNVTVTPSLFAINPYTNKAYPIAYGLVSETELRDTIYKTMQLEYREKR